MLVDKSITRNGYVTNYVTLKIPLDSMGSYANSRNAKNYSLNNHHYSFYGDTVETSVSSKNNRVVIRKVTAVDL